MHLRKYQFCENFTRGSLKWWFSHICIIRTLFFDWNVITTHQTKCLAAGINYMLSFWAKASICRSWLKVLPSPSSHCSVVWWWSFLHIFGHNFGRGSSAVDDLAGPNWRYMDGGPYCGTHNHMKSRTYLGPVDPEQSTIWLYRYSLSGKGSVNRARRRIGLCPLICDLSDIAR